MAAGPAGSFVTAVLATAGRLDKDDLNSKLGQLSRKIDEVKLEVHNALIKKYAEFYPLFDATRQLRDRVVTVQGEMESALASIDKQIKAQLRISATDYESLQARYNESKAVLTILGQLVELSDGFQSIDRLIESSSYVEATQMHSTVRGIISELSRQHGDHLKLLKCLAGKRIMLEEKLETCVIRRWNELVTWKPSVDGNDNPCFELHITCSSKSREEIASLAQSLHNLGLLDDEMKKFGQQLMKNFVNEILTKSNATVSDRKDVTAVVVSVSVPRQGSTDRVSTGVSLPQISAMLELLNASLLNVEVVDNRAEPSSEEERKPVVQTLMSIVGNHCSSLLLEAVIRDHLSVSIPSSIAELESYDGVVQCAKNYEKKLAELGFISAEDKTLSNYVDGAEMLFTAKRCQEVLVEARTLMMSDIHNIVKVSEEDCGAMPVGSLTLPHGPGGSTSKKVKASSICSEVKLDPIFSFPPCHISVAAQQLVKLGYDILSEATSAAVTDDQKSSSSSTPSDSPSGVSSQMAVQLFYCVRSVFEMYASVVPVYHRERLMQFPQMAAVYHNDCMYIAHHLMLMGHQFRPGLPEPLCNGAATFIDLVPVLRRSGTRCFLEQLSIQKTRLIQALNSAHGFTDLSNDDNFEVAEHAIAQLLHQLRHLVNVCKDILPAHVYAKSIGTLLNTAIVELVSCVVTLDDISKKNAQLLSGLLTTFSDSAKDEILASITNQFQTSFIKLVPKWGRLDETKFVLTSRMQEIVDRWADGKGPLAAEMTATEVKQMIRALFQNTEQRAAALAAIK